jgi:hypothetical protein
MRGDEDEQPARSNAGEAVSVRRGRDAGSRPTEKDDCDGYEEHEEVVVTQPWY